MMLNSDTRETEEPNFDNQKCNSLLWSGTIQILLPVAALAFIWGRRGLLTKFLLQFDKNCISVICPSLKEKQKLLQWIEWYIPTTWFHIHGSSLNKANNFWKDGSLLCNLINSFYPGACSDPRSHRYRPPSHGQALAYKYLGIAPVFTEHDLTQDTLNEKQAQDLSNYLQQIRESCKEEVVSNSRYSSNYIAKGMGLVSGEENRKIYFYIYVNSFDSFNANDIIINIKAPNDVYETLNIPSSCIKRKIFPNLFSNNLTYRSRSEQLFLKPISNWALQINTKIPIQFLIENDRVKVEYIPRNTGVYTVSIITNGSHILGSPFPVSISENTIGVNEDFEEINPLPSLTIKKTVKKTILSKAIDFFDHETFESQEMNHLREENVEVNYQNKNIPYLESNSTSPICQDHIEHEVTENHKSSLIPCRNPEKTTQKLAYNNNLTNKNVDLEESEIFVLPEIDEKNNWRFKIEYSSDNDLNILNYLPHLKYDRSVSCNELNNDNRSYLQSSETLDDNTNYYLKFKDKLSFWESRSNLSSLQSTVKQGVSLPNLNWGNNEDSSVDFYNKSEFKSKQQYWKFLSSQTIDCITYNRFSRFNSTDFKNKFKERQAFWERLCTQNCLGKHLITKNTSNKLNSKFSFSETNIQLLRPDNSKVDIKTIDHSVFQRRQSFWEKISTLNVNYQTDKNINKTIDNEKHCILKMNNKEDAETFSNCNKKDKYAFNEVSLKFEDSNLTDDFKSISTVTDTIRMRFYKHKDFFRSLENSIS